MKNSNFTGIPENSKVLKFGLGFLYLIAIIVIISASNFVVQNEPSEVIKMYLWPILTIILFSTSVYIYKHTKLQSQSISPTSKAVRKSLIFVQTIIVFLGLIGFVTNNNLTGYRGTGLFYGIFCKIFTYFNPHLVITGMLGLILILNLTYTERNKRNNFWLLIFSILLSASILFLPSSITTCLV